MITVMRKHHKVLMIVITALVCISFSWYWNRTDFSQMGGGAVGTLYDRTISQVEFQRHARLLRLGSALGMNELVQTLAAGAQTENEAFEAFSWNLMVLRHEAEALGIKPTATEIAEEVKKLPAFQGEKGFDLAKYTDFADHGLAPMGFSESQIEELAADSISLQRIQKLLGAGVSAADTQMRSDFERAYSKNEVAVVRFHSADFAPNVQVNDADIAKYYEAHKAQLKTEEKRQVKFVAFGLSDEQKKLTGKPRIDVLQKLADRANDFTDALQAKGANFDAVAAKFQVAPKETSAFTQAQPDPQLAGTPTLTQAAFGLTKTAPNSDAVQTPDGFIIEHLSEIEAARPLSLAEARPKILQDLKAERVQALVAAKAEAAAKQLRDALKSGKSAEDAAQQAGVKAEKVPAFALVDNAPGAMPVTPPKAKQDTPDLPAIKEAVSDLTPGSVSELVPGPDGGMLVILEKREPLNATLFAAARPLLETRSLRNKEQVVFYEWLRDRRRAAGVEEHKTPLASG